MERERERGDLAVRLINRDQVSLTNHTKRQPISIRGTKKSVYKKVKRVETEKKL